MTEKENMKICLLGASFDTGNLGVSALAESSIKIILNRWPDAEVVLLGSGSTDGEHCLKLSGREIRVRIVRMRFCKNVFLRSHFCVLLLNAILLKLLPFRRFRDLLSAINPYVKTLVETDKVFDITGGDSFSDIYGLRRFLIFGFLQKWLVTQFGKELILLPQTYGPFKRSITRLMAKCILKRASVVYARDSESVEYVRALLGNHSVNGKIRFMPDVAFVLDSHEPEHVDIGTLDSKRIKDSIVVGLNISGLLFNGGYTQENMFGLKTNYRELICSVVDYLMKDERRLVLLVPHVVTPCSDVEDDPNACRQLYEKLSEKYPDRIFLTQGQYNQNEIKYIIGLCDFFIGSRMHSCIAALSQSIPAVGIAYSKKFHGVFESVGLGNCVANACQCNKDELLSIVEAAFEMRDQIRVHLNKIIPEVNKNILNMFEPLSAP
ncbi:MAG: polysaccharide pyruvyl transferase family protein [Desulfobacterales bacterium]|nr:polysaccharide pyruvyl transferase family protein [Desulfobacterales bacterium]